MSAIAPLHDLDLHYKERGSGDPVILIGGLSQSKESWVPFAEELAKDFRVITFDNRGAGETGSPDLPYRLATMAGDTLGLIQHLELEKVHVVGASMGGMIAQQLAADHPERVGRLVLAVTGLRLDGYTRQLIESFTNLRRSSIPDRQFHQQLGLFLFSRSFFERPGAFEQVLEAWAAEPYPQLDYGFVRQAEAVLEWDREDRSEPPKHETLVIGAEEDMVFPPALGRELAEWLPNATYKELPGGHAGVAEYPEQWLAAVRDFLSGG